MIDRGHLSRVANYREQIEALGLWGWCRYKLHRVRSRFSSAGTELRFRTPLAAHPLIIRAHTSDTNVFSQIFIHREYRCLDDIYDAELIIDGGANVGYSSAYLATRYPRAKLVAVEPDPGNVAVLAKNLMPYGDQCEIVQSGLWSSSVGLVVTAGELGERKEWATTVRAANGSETATLMATDIGALLENSGHERISILKLDIEGSEAEVFSRNTASWIEKVDNLVIELHGSECEEIVLSAMSGRGFEITRSEELTVFKRSHLVPMVPGSELVQPS